MSKLIYLLPALAATGCQDQQVSQIAAAATQPATADLQAMLGKAAASPAYLDNFNAKKKLAISTWIKGAQDQLTDAAVMVNGNLLSGLRSQVQLGGDVGDIIGLVNSRFTSIGTILRAYGTPTNVAINANDINDYLEMASAGLAYARTGVFRYAGNDSESTTYLRSLNVALSYEAAASGTGQEAVAAAANIGFVYTIYGLLKYGSGMAASLDLVASPGTQPAGPSSSQGGGFGQGVGQGGAQGAQGAQGQQGCKPGGCMGKKLCGQGGQNSFQQRQPGRGVAGGGAGTGQGYGASVGQGGGGVGQGSGGQGGDGSQGYGGSGDQSGGGGYTR